MSPSLPRVPVGSSVQGPTRRLLLAGALAAAVTACSSNGSPSSGGRSKRLRIGYFAFPSGDLLVKRLKLLEKALPDYQVTWVKFDSGASINQAFLGKSLDNPGLAYPHRLTDRSSRRQPRIRVLPQPAQEGPRQPLGRRDIQ
jgi:taurine transport system substrate-binding protein